MSQPSIPNITPSVTISREDALNLILSSIAMEELSLSHILNAEGEQLQYVLGTLPGLSGPAATIEDLLAVNQSVRNTLDSATKNQMFLQSKMESALNALTVTQSGVVTGATGPTGPTGPTGATGAGLENVTIWNPTASGSYTAGEVISYEGKLYVVVNTPPNGTPGSSADYQEVLSGVVGPTGPTGPTGATGAGLESVTIWDPTGSGSYTAGEVISYEGKLYVVVNTPPNGTPGSSADYQEVLSGVVGPTGPTGPTGPSAPGSGVPEAVYRADLSAQDSSFEVTVGNVIFTYHRKNDNELDLTIRARTVPFTIDLKRSTQYDGGSEGYTLDSYTLTTEPLATDTLIFSRSRESNQTWLRQQDPATGLWSLHEVNIFASGGGARTTIWVYLIDQEVSFN